MCGIAGVVGPDASVALIERMTEALSHRGPDDIGYHQDGQVFLGQTRLKIIDLVTGDQPMSNEDGTVWVVFNGEIYNFRELRKELERAGHRFHSNSDTEALVHGYEEYGTDLFRRLDGIFAFALWDSTGATTVSRPRQLWRQAAALFFRRPQLAIRLRDQGGAA